MAAAFNLTAQINLRGPTNTRAIASSIRKQLSNIKVKVDLDIKGSSSKSIAAVNKGLQNISINAARANSNINQLNASIQQLATSLGGLGSSGPQTLAATGKAASSAGKSVATVTTQMQEFGKQSGLAIRRFAAFSTVTGVIYGLTSAVSSAYKEFITFDKEIVRLSQVTGTSIAGLSGITDEITKLSTGLGVASSDLLQVSVTLAQAGLSAQDTKTALEALAKSALAPSFDDLNSTVEGSIALMRQFNISTGELEGALGSINAVAAAFAVEASDIITAIQRTGGVFANASRGVSVGTDALNEFVAIFTSVRATTRESAETIATGLRTIFTRIQRGSTIEALKEYGVVLTDLEGKFVGPYEAVRRLSEGLSGLDPRDLRFAKIVEELGGFRQIGKVIPLIQQFATAENALGVAQKGQASLSKNALEAQKSLAVQFEKTRQAFVALIRDIGNSGTFRTIATISLTTANAFISLASALKPLLPMLTALAAIKGASILSEFSAGFLGGLGGGGAKGRSGGGGGVGSGGSGSGGGGGGRGRSGGASSKAVTANTQAISANTSQLSTINTTLATMISSLNNLTQAINSMTPPAGGATTANGGGRILGFAKGGSVPGVGRGDKVPAMLEPGEVVMSNRAVNKYGRGNLVRMNNTTKSPVSIDINDSNTEASHVGNNFGRLTRAEVESYASMPVGKGQRSAKFDAEKTRMSGLSASEVFKLDLPRIANQNMKTSKPGVIANSLSAWIKKNTDKLFSSKRSIPESAVTVGPEIFGNSFATAIDNLNKEIIKDSNLSIAFNKVRPLLDPEYLLSKSNKADLFSSQRGTTGSSQIRHEGFDISQISSRKFKRRSIGGAIQRFMSGGQARSRGQIFSSSPTPMLRAILQDIEKNPKTKDYKFRSYQEELTETLNQAYRGVLQGGTKPTKDPVTKDSIVSMYDQYNTPQSYVKATVGALEDDLKYITGGDTQKGSLKKRKGVEVGDMLDVIRSYQALGLDYTLNTALAAGRTNETLGEFQGEDLAEEYKKAGLDKVKLSTFVKQMDAAAQFKFPDKLYSGLGDSKLDLILKDTNTKNQKDLDGIIGKTFTMPSFLSASDAEALATSFARVGMLTILTNPKRKGIIPEQSKQTSINRESQSDRSGKLRILQAVTGQKGFAGFDIDEYYADAYDSEGEYIFPSNSKFKVLSFDKRTAKLFDKDAEYRHLDMEIQQLSKGGIAQRKVGYIDYDVIANSANEAIVSKGMESTGVKGPRLYTDYLTQLAVKARKNSNLQKLRAIYGVAGSGKTTLARGQGTDTAKLRQTERFPVLSPEDIQKASEIIILSSSVSKDKIDDFFGATDRTYTLSSTTQAEKERVRSQRGIRDVTGVGLEGRTPGTTSGVATDTAIGEALLTDKLGERSAILGRSSSGRLRSKKGNELVDIVKKNIGFTWGGFAPMTAGHESILDAAAAMGYSPEDFLFLVGANEGIKLGDPSSYRTAIFNQDARVLLAKAGAGSRGATVLSKPKDFEIPQAFDITPENSLRRKVLIPSEGSTTFVGDKTAEETQKYIDAGYRVKNTGRTGGISGTMVRDLIMSGDMAELQKVLSPNVYDLISNNIGRIQNRAKILPDIIEQVKKSQEVKLSDIDKAIKAIGISRVDKKKVASDPEYAAKAQVLEELRKTRDKIKSSGSFEPYKLLDELAKSQPDKYGLDFSSTRTSEVKPIRTITHKKSQKVNIGGLIRKYASAGEVSPTSGKPVGRAEILRVLGVQKAAEAAGIGVLDVDKLLGLRNPDANQIALREAIEKEYIKKLNRKAGAAQARVTKLEDQGLVFGAAGMLGDTFAAQNIDINSDKLSKSAQVRVVSGVMKPEVANSILSILDTGSMDIVQRAADAIKAGYGENERATGNISSNTNTMSSVQGGLIEWVVEKLGGPGAVKGKGFDFPDGLKGAAKYFNINPDIPTDVKRTLAGPSTIKDNIVTYLKNVKGYAGGGLIQKFMAGSSGATLLGGAGIARQTFASGGSVPALVSNGEAYVPPKIAKKIGYGTLNRMNQADKNGMGRFSSGGISVFKGPGSGTSDSISTNLPVGSFIIREKATKALGFNSGGAVGVRKFASGGSVDADRMDYLNRIADKLGITVQQYERSIRQQIYKQAAGSATAKTSAQTDIQDLLVKNLGNIGDADVEKETREGLTDLFKKIDPKNTKLSQTIDDIVNGMKKGFSISDLKNSSTELAKILNQNITIQSELSSVTAEFEKELGFLTGKMKVRGIDVRAQKSLDEGKFGSLEKGNIRQAQRNLESPTGRVLDTIGQGNSAANIPGMKLLEKSFPNVADKLTKMGDKVGGITGVISVAASQLSSQMPTILSTLDHFAGTVSETSPAIAGLQGALKSASSFGLSGSIVGKQAFGTKGAAIGGAVGLAGGAVSGFIKESTAKEVEMAMKGVSGASNTLSKTLDELANARTFAEREELQDRANRNYEALNVALETSAKTIKDNRIWNAVSGGLEGFLSTLTTVMGMMAAANMGGGGFGAGFGGGGGKGSKPRRKPRKAAIGGRVGLATGGLVPVKLASGEGVFTPPLPTSKNELDQMNQADRNGYRPSFGGQMGIVPGNGSGKVDNFDTMLPEGSYVIRTDAMNAMQEQEVFAAKGGRISRQGLAVGGKVQSFASGGGVRGYAAGGVVLRILGGAIKQLGPYLSAAIAGSIFEGFTAFADNSTEKERLKAEIESLQQLRRIADNSEAFATGNKGYAERVMTLSEPIEKASMTADQRRSAYGRSRDSSGRLNALNILQEQEARTSLSAEGMNVSDNQSVQEYLDSLGEGTEKRKKADAAVMKAQERLRQRIYLEARQRQGVSEDVAAKEYRSAQFDNKGGAKNKAAQDVNTLVERELGGENRSRILADRLEIVNRAVKKFTLDITDVMNRLSSNMTRIVDEIGASTDRANSISGEFSGSGAKAYSGDSENLRVLQNISAYSREELGSAVDSISKGLGDNEQTQKMGDFIKGLQVIQQELPLILRDTAGGNINEGAESNVRSKLGQMFGGLNMSPEIRRQLEDSVMEWIQASTSMNRQGMTMEDLAGNVEGFKELSDAAEKARQTFEEYARKQLEVNRQLGAVSDNLAASFDKLADNAIRVQDISLQSALQLKEKFGQTISLREMNAPFESSVRGLTGGITDPAAIGKQISEAIAQKRALETDPSKATSALGSGQIAGLTSKINKYQRALDVLANSTDRASSALKKIDEQSQISAGRRRSVMDFFSMLDDPEAMLNFTKQSNSYNRVMGGAGGMRDIQGALSTLQSLEGSRSPEEFANLQKQLFDNITRILGNSGMDPAIVKQFQDSFSADFGKPQDNPQIKPFIDAFNEAANIQKAAVQTQSDLIEQGALVLSNSLSTAASDFTTKMQNAVANVVAQLNSVADRLGLAGAGRPAEPRSKGGMIGYYAMGDMVNFTPKGTDTVPAMLTPGEFVVNRAATSKHLPLLQSINSGKYSSGGKVKYLATGGRVLQRAAGRFAQQSDASPEFDLGTTTEFREDNSFGNRSISTLSKLQYESRYGIPGVRNNVKMIADDTYESLKNRSTEESKLRTEGTPILYHDENTRGKIKKANELKLNKKQYTELSIGETERRIPLFQRQTAEYYPNGADFDHSVFDQKMLDYKDLPTLNYLNVDIRSNKQKIAAISQAMQTRDGFPDLLAKYLLGLKEYESTWASMGLGMVLDLENLVPGSITADAGPTIASKALGWLSKNTGVTKGISNAIKKGATTSLSKLKQLTTKSSGIEDIPPAQLGLPDLVPANPSSARTTKTPKPTSGFDRVIQITDDVKSLIGRLQSETGSKLASSFNKLGADNLLQNTRNALGILGINPEDFYLAMPNSIKVAPSLKKMRGYYAANKGAYTGLGDVVIQKDVTAKTLYHEMVHSLFDGVRKKGGGAWERYQSKVMEIFSGNDPYKLTDAIAQYSDNYKAEDIVYGKYYKLRWLDELTTGVKNKDLRKKIIDTYPELKSFFNNPKNQKIPYDTNFDRIVGGAFELIGKPEYLKSSSDFGMEEFLTKLVDSANLMSNQQRLGLSSILDDLLAGPPPTLRDNSVLASLNTPTKWEVLKQQWTRVTDPLRRMASPRKSTPTTPKATTAPPTTTGTSAGGGTPRTGSPGARTTGQPPVPTKPRPKTKSNRGRSSSTSTRSRSGKSWSDYLASKFDDTKQWLSGGDGPWTSRASTWLGRISNGYVLGTLGVGAGTSLWSWITGNSSLPPDASSSSDSSRPTGGPLPPPSFDPKNDPVAEIKYASKFARKFAITKVSAKDAFTSDDGKYKFGQVLSAAKNLGLKDPMGVTDFRVRSATIPSYEAGDGSDKGILLSSKERADKNAELKELDETIAAAGDYNIDNDPNMRTIVARRDALRRQLQGDYRAQVNMGVPTGDGDPPKFSMIAPRIPQPEDFGFSSLDKYNDNYIFGLNKRPYKNIVSQAMSSSYLKDYTELEKQMALITSPLADADAAPEGSVSGVTKEDQDKARKAIADMVNRYGISGTNDEDKKSQLVSYLQNMSSKDRRIVDADKAWNSFDGNIKSYNNELEKYWIIRARYENREQLANDPLSMMEGSPSIDPKARDAKLAEIRRIDDTIRDLQKQPGGPPNKAEIEKKIAEKQRILDELYAGSDEVSFKSVPPIDYLLFNHPNDVNFINPFKQFNNSESVYGLPNTKTTASAQRYASDTNAIINQLLTSYGAAFGIKDPIPSNSDQFKQWIKGIDSEKATSLPSVSVGKNWKLDKLQNMYSVKKDGESWASKFGLWSFNNEENAYDTKFAENYKTKFLEKARSYLEAKSTQVSKEQMNLPQNTANYLKAIEALSRYSGSMDKNVYGKVNAGFGALNIDKKLEGANDEEKAKNLFRKIGRGYNVWRKANIDKVFGGIATSDLAGWKRVDDKNNFPGSPEELRALVTTDVNTLERIKNLDTYVINSILSGGAGPAQMRSISSFGNLLAAGNFAIGEDGAMGLEGVTADTRFLDLLAQTLNFTNPHLVQDRQAKFQFVIDKDLSSALKNKIYAKDEPALDSNLQSLMEAYNLWDSLKSYGVDPDTRIPTVNIIEPSSGQLESIIGGSGKSAVIGNKSIKIDSDSSFVSNYLDAFTEYKDEYDKVRLAMDQISKSAANTGQQRINELIGIDTPFGNAAYIQAQKMIDIQSLKDKPTPATDATTGEKKPEYKARGGMIYASAGTLVNYRPRGTDTVPAMLTPGEFVINRAATQKHLPLLQAINNGSNNALVSNGSAYAKSGGVIQPIYRAEGGGANYAGMAQGVMKAMGFDTSGISSVFDTFIQSFNTETNNFGSLINNLARVFPALNAPVSAFGGHVDKLVKALNDLKSIEIKGPNIPDTININSDTIRVELIAPQDTNYKLSDEDKRQIAQSLETRLKTLTTLGR